MPEPLPISLEALGNQSGIDRASLTEHDGAVFWLERDGEGRRLAVLAPRDDPRLESFRGEGEPYTGGLTLKRCEADGANARALRRVLHWLEPTRLGLKTSAGCGDRLGLATPGHARAFQEIGGKVAAIFAQQSIREMTRTKRTPEDVMKDATWGAFGAGWRESVGADADHLKTPEDIDRCARAGFSFFTIDPGEHVDDEAHGAGGGAVSAKIGALPWKSLESSPQELETRYVGKAIELEERALTLEREAVLRAAAKYGRAVAHVTKMYRHLEAKGIPFELEISVDETETPTSHAEHAYIALELRRLGVSFVSLAPRYVGRFEKGIDYIGDLDTLREDLAGHAALARALGPYKLSLHSGSDKFSVYPIIHEATKGMVHLKTAGTSYLEALRVIARVQPELFRDIGALARDSFERDRASYHVSAELENVPDFAALDEAQPPKLLDDDDARQVLHVTFGSALDAFKPKIMEALKRHEEAHHDGLRQHFVKHLRPFARKT
jgi:tagaturonate epimerase